MGSGVGEHWRVLEWAWAGCGQGYTLGDPEVGMARGVQGSEGNTDVPREGRCLGGRKP